MIMGDENKSRKLINELRNFILDKESKQRNAIVDYVKYNRNKGKNSVAMCFRGDNICLYYRCHMLLLIKYSKKKIVGEFNFRHSRFTEKYENIAKQLKDDLGVYNFNKNKYIDENGEEKPYTFDSIAIRFDIAQVKQEGEKWVYTELIEDNKLNEILGIYAKLIDDFLNPELNTYFWQGKDDKPKKGDKAKKSRNTEKDAQQMLYSKYFSCKDAFIYDLEYTEHRLTKEEAAKLGSEELENKEVKGRFDLLKLVQEDNGDVLEFIELKSTLNACRNRKSGVHKHINDYVKYIDNYDLVKARMEEALDTIDILKQIFGNDIIPFTPKKFMEPVRSRIRFIFTDEAEKYEFPIVVSKYSEM